MTRTVRVKSHWLHSLGAYLNPMFMLYVAEDGSQGQSMLWRILIRVSRLTLLASEVATQLDLSQEGLIIGELAPLLSRYYHGMSCKLNA